MPNLLVSLRFDGSAYHGWQVQKNALSVQEVFQNALQSIYGKKIDVKGCSRTDTGVHAKMFCVSFFAPYYKDEYHTVSALNGHLPDDIKAYACREVSDTFHARYCATAKEYVYYVYNGKFVNPFYSKYSYKVNYHIDEKVLNETAQAFVGTHDFTSFCSVKSDKEDRVRTVYSFSVTRKGDLVIFKVRGDGFLYNMVRIMVGTLLGVASGKIKGDEIPQILTTKDRNRAGKTAPASGLFLNKVIYEWGENIEQRR